MQWVEPVELMGERARLAPMERAHAAALFETTRDPRVWTYMPAPMASEADMERFIDAALGARERGEEMPFTIFDRESERAVGSTRFLDIAPQYRGLEIGWTWLTPEVWRTRINTECKYLLLRHAFESLGAIRVQLKTDLRNVRSQQAIERLGAVKEGVLRRHRILPDGYVRDSVYYSVIAEEWPSVRERLLGFLARPAHGGASRSRS